MCNVGTNSVCCNAIRRMPILGYRSGSRSEWRLQGDPTMSAAELCPVSPEQNAIPNPTVATG